uniref:CARMIL C-terminal domain-containing protein n=1 Tax=Panagrellus redivivus TaxID=6233 RepID=A0A7E4UR91_PANRE
MMLGKLVSKFKRQSIHDGGSPRTVVSAPSLVDCASEGIVRKSPRLNPGLTYPGPDTTKCVNFEDSDDDDLDEMSNATGELFADDDDVAKMMMSTTTTGTYSQSPPTLTSRPMLSSEIDTNSWDSTGCESGIVLRESAERDSLSQTDLLDDTSESTTPVDRTSGFCIDFSALKAELDSTATTDRRETASGAFQPVGGRIVDSPTPIGEKRRWPGNPSPIASRTRSAMAGVTSPSDFGEATRPTLVARRTRVKVLFHDPNPSSGVKRCSNPISIPGGRHGSTFYTPNDNENPAANGILTESPPNNPSLKRGRKGGERPSLDFDKMLCSMPP